MIRTMSAALCTAALLAACQAPATAPTTTVPGETATLFGASVSSWAKLDGEQRPTEVGITLPLSAVEAAPTGEGAPTMMRLKFPESVTSSTFINHLGLDYSAVGHPPEKVYDKPHFDLHFYAIPSAEVDAIDCSDETSPATDAIPAGFALLPPPKGECVPKMGYHASMLSSPELNQENPQPFTHTLIMGFYGGKMIFVEPMVTRDFLLSKQSFSQAVPKPASLGRATRYPTSFKAAYDEQAKAYIMTLGDFVDAQ